MHPQAPNMGYGGNFSCQPSEATVIDSQWVPSAEDDLADARIVANVVKCVLPLGGAGIVLFVGKMPAEAVATVDGAAAADNQQKPAMIFVYNAGQGVCMLFAQGVEHVAWVFLKLFADWENLPEQWVVRVPRPHPGQIGFGYTQGELAACRVGEWSQYWSQIEPAQQFSGISDARGEQILPACGLNRRRRYMYHCGFPRMGGRAFV